MVGKDQQISLVASLCALTHIGGIQKVEHKSGIRGEG